MSAASSKGMPGVRIVPTAVPCEASVMEDIDAGIDEALDNIISALIKPLTTEETSPKPKEMEKPSRIIFKGDLAEINLFFYRRGWTDGLPIIPPTEEAVAEMLTGTDLPPDHLVGELIPRLGKITVEKIAINAVIAGALPTYMPLLIAGVQTLLHPSSNFGTWGVSTGSWAPFWVINGPIRNDLHVNSGSGALSPGDMANAAIGRAMGLIIKNIGGARKGIEDMGTLGNPGKYSLVIAENEEDTPWEPMHVENGFSRDDSTITVSSPNTYIQLWPYASDDEGILRGILYNIIPRGGPCIIITPQHAKILASKGWTKQDIKAFIAEYARVPAHHLGSYWGTSSPMNIPGQRPGLHRGRVPMRETDSVSMIRDPNSIAILVAGGPGAFIGLLMPVGVFTGGKTTRKIELPANWDKLVKKYKGVVPTYVRY
ncbi:hypothetical protein ACFL7M_05125 [Thermodesulfobacteriota bacterium]